MKTSTEITPDFISRANEVRRLKPGDGLLLDFYEQIFIEQENSKKDVRLADYTIPEDVVSVKLHEKFPLVEVSQFGIDTGAAENLFIKLCKILREGG